jgi:hypothetical protein
MSDEMTEEERALRKMAAEVADPLGGVLRSVLALVDAARKERDDAFDWEDVDDEWTKEIDAAHPTRGGSHEDYATAMKMVGHRHSKGELVALVCWLLSKRK